MSCSFQSSLQLQVGAHFSERIQELCFTIILKVGFGLVCRFSGGLFWVCVGFYFFLLQLVLQRFFWPPSRLDLERGLKVQWVTKVTGQSQWPHLGTRSLHLGSGRTSKGISWNKQVGSCLRALVYRGNNWGDWLHARLHLSARTFGQAQNINPNSFSGKW
jgi:hypothetical protein